MTNIDLFALYRLSRTAADLGHYTTGKLLNSAAAALVNRALYTEPLPKTDQDFVAALEAGYDKVAEADRNPQQKPGGRKFQPDLRHFGQFRVDVVDIKAVGEQQNRRWRVVLKPHSSRPLHPQPAAGGAAID